MSAELAKEARSKMRAKAHRLASGDPHAKVDASSWSPAEDLKADVQTGERPVSKRAYKRGGKVEGESAKVRADRKPRKSGGMVNEYVNRDVKAANEERDGEKHVGGLKRGGRAAGGDAGATVPTERMSFQGGPSRMSQAAGLKHGGHVDEKEDEALIHREVKADALKRANGGPVGYHVVDRRTGKVVGRFKNGHAASSMIDRKDNAYGAYQHSRVPVYAEDKGAEHFSPKTASAPVARKHGGRADAHWIKGAIKHPGALHRELHVAEGKRIPEHKLEKAAHSSNKMVAKRAHLAKTLRGMHRAVGGSVSDGEIQGTRPVGGRMARKDGGRAGKGKMSVNIIIAAGKGDQAAAPPPAGPQASPVPMPGGPPPMQVPVQGPPPMGGGGIPPGMMPRKSGGRAGAGSGLGRLEKIRDYGETQHR